MALEGSRRQAERARSLCQPVVRILGNAGRTSKFAADYHWMYGPIMHVAGQYAAPILWSNAGVGPEDIDITGAYDAFTFTATLAPVGAGFTSSTVMPGV